MSLDVNDVASIAYPWRGLTKKTGGGLQLGTLVMICSGTGVGKTTLISQLALHLHKLGESCGMLCLEEHNNITLKRLLGIHSQTASDKFDAKFSLDEKYKIFDVFGDHPMFFYDHFGSIDVETISSRIRFMVKALGVHGFS